jgi:hypothetical protein
MKHRKDWTEWRKKREQEYKRTRFLSELMATCFADSLFQRSVFLQSVKESIPFVSGRRMRVPFGFQNSSV